MRQESAASAGSEAREPGSLHGYWVFIGCLAGWVVLYGFTIPSRPVSLKRPSARVTLHAQFEPGPGTFVWLGFEHRDEWSHLGIFGTFRRQARRQTAYYRSGAGGEERLTYPEVCERLRAAGAPPPPPPTFVRWSFDPVALVFAVIVSLVPALFSWVLWIAGPPRSSVGVGLQGVGSFCLLWLVATPLFVALGRPAPPLGLVPPDLALALTLLAMGVGCAVWRRARASHTTSSHG